MKTALSIAGCDPTGGAGILADLQVFRTLQVHGMGVVTALTVQDSSKVHSTLPVFPSVVLDQLRCLLADIQPAAVKTGMLASDDVLRSVDLGLASLEAGTPLIIDPVLASSDGTILLERRAWPGLKELMGRATLVTPNVVEAQLLTETDASSQAGSETAARIFIEELGAGAALIKGGHRDGAPDDLLAVKNNGSIEYSWLTGERIDGAPVHGTGCALASAITAELAKGSTLAEAVSQGRKFIRAGFSSSISLGGGSDFLSYSS